MSGEKDKDTEHLERTAISTTQVRGFLLQVIEGPNRGKLYRAEGEYCTIGVHSSCDLVLRDPTVSRFHCVLTSGPKWVGVRDFDSSNGTILDGVRVRDAYLKRGSVLRLGRTSIQFQLLEQPAELPISSRTRFGLLVGASLAMRRLFALLERAAHSSATILLEGETGTGKSAAARSIHMEGPRKDGPFVMIDCSALPGNLLESELFGHERGSFTGAHARRTGAFAAANGGTVFLDELGELPLDLQAKLLSVLENREIRPIGSNRPQPIDVRVIAATNRELRTEVNAGRFREDLYYRLSVVGVTLPPLRQRIDDLPALVDHLLGMLGVPDDEIAAIATPELLAQLSRSAWPGNIRELRNYLERHLLFRDLETTVERHVSDRDGAPDSSSAVEFELDLPFPDARKRVIAAFEQAYVTAVLDAYGGKVSRAAEHAGITRTYLYRLLQRYGIETSG